MIMFHVNLQGCNNPILTLSLQIQNDNKPIKRYIDIPSLAKWRRIIVLNWHQEHIKTWKFNFHKWNQQPQSLGVFLLTPSGPGRACSPACACSTYHTYDTWTRGHCNSWMRLKIGTVPLSLGDQRAGITAICRSYILEMVQGGTNAVIDLSNVFLFLWFLLSPCHSGQKVLSNTLAFLLVQWILSGDALGDFFGESCPWSRFGNARRILQR